MLREHPPHPCPVLFGNNPTIIFLTVCAQDRKPILAKPETANLIRSSWERAASWIVGKYVIMPDHIHLFCSPVDTTVSIIRWTRYWKSLCSRKWPRVEEHPIWQTDCWDTQMRTMENYMFQWQYVAENPVRKGLVSNSEDWPFQGEINSFGWFD